MRRAAVALLVVLAAACGDDDGGGAATGSSTTTRTSGGIELVLDAPTSAPVGQPFVATLTIRNAGDSVVFWQAGGCGDPAVIGFGPAGADRPHEAPSEGWDGEPASLAAWLDVGNTSGGWHEAHPPSDAALRGRFCTSDSRMRELGPGDELTQEARVEVRVPPGDLAPAHEVTAAFSAFARPDDYGGTDAVGPSERARAAVEVRLEDDDLRSDLEAAVEAFAASPALRTFVDDTQVANVENHWSTGLSWWRGAWELWVDPYFEEGGPRALRLRYDTAERRLVDARVVWHGLAAEDEPGIPERPPGGDRPDDVLAP